MKIFQGDTGVEHYITDLKDGIEARRVLMLLGPGYLKFSDDDVVVPGDRLAAGDYRFYRDSAGLKPILPLVVTALHHIDFSDVAGSVFLTSTRMQEY